MTAREQYQEALALANKLEQEAQAACKASHEAGDKCITLLPSLFIEEGTLSGQWRLDRVDKATGDICLLCFNDSLDTDHLREISLNNGWNHFSFALGPHMLYVDDGEIRLSLDRKTAMEFIQQAGITVDPSSTINYLEREEQRFNEGLESVKKMQGLVKNIIEGFNNGVS